MSNCCDASRLAAAEVAGRRANKGHLADSGISGHPHAQPRLPTGSLATAVAFAQGPTSASTVAPIAVAAAVAAVAAMWVGGALALRRLSSVWRPSRRPRRRTAPDSSSRHGMAQPETYGATTCAMAARRRPAPPRRWCGSTCATHTCSTGTLEANARAPAVRCGDSGERAGRGAPAADAAARHGCSSTASYQRGWAAVGKDASASSRVGGCRRDVRGVGEGRSNGANGRSGSRGHAGSSGVSVGVGVSGGRRLGARRAASASAVLLLQLSLLPLLVTSQVVNIATVSVSGRMAQWQGRLGGPGSLCTAAGSGGTGMPRMPCRQLGLESWEGNAIGCMESSPHSTAARFAC